MSKLWARSIMVLTRDNSLLPLVKSAIKALSIFIQSTGSSFISIIEEYPFPESLNENLYKEVLYFLA